MELTVVGAGVAGSALTRLARGEGHRVRLIGGPPSASLAALSVVRPKYVTEAPDAAAAVTYALERYAEAGCQILHGATVSSKQKPELKTEPDWWAVEPGPFLVKPDERRDDVTPGWGDPRSEATVHATGAGGLEGKISYGCTWVNVDPRALAVEGLTIHRYAPYKSADAVPFKSGCRLGSSSAATVSGARTEASRIMDVARQLGWIRRDDGWYQIVARRVKREELIQQGESGVWTFGGFHRSGWSLAPLRAAELLAKIVAVRA